MSKKHHTIFWKFLNSFIANKTNPWQKFKWIFPDAYLKSIISLIIAQRNPFSCTVSAWIFGWEIWLIDSSKMKLWQLLEDLKPSVFVFSCAWCIAVAAAATRIKPVTRMRQPGAVRTVREFESHHVTILHRVPIICVLWVNLKGGVGIAQPVVPYHGTCDSTNTTI